MGLWDGSGISWTIWKQSAPHSRQITAPMPHQLDFYRPDALPDSKPTVLKHWRQHYALCASSFSVKLATHVTYYFYVACLSELPVLCPEMATEGTLWFSNLLIPDTTLILPLCVCLLNLFLIEVRFFMLITSCYNLQIAPTLHGGPVKSRP